MCKRLLQMAECVWNMANNKNHANNGEMVENFY